jgi:propanediol dehydratase small subunit
MATKSAVKKAVKTSKATSEKSLDERMLEWGLLLDHLKRQADGDIYPSTFCIGLELALRSGSDTLADVYEGLAEAMEVAEDLIEMFGEDTTIDELAKKGKRKN